MDQLPKVKHLYWGCRRGMLELDLLLIPFFENCYSTLNPEQQQSFEALLDCTDPELFSWLMGTSEPIEGHLRKVVHLIRQHAYSITETSLF